MSKLCVLARYWNDMEYLSASLRQLERWKPDRVVISEGCWDRTKPQASVDGTLEFLKYYADTNCSKIILMDNIRASNNYRENQAETSNKAMELMGCEPGDWMLILDADWFYLEEDIDTIREMIAEYPCNYDFFPHFVMCFLTGSDRYTLGEDRNRGFLPVRIKSNSKWIATNHISLDGKTYDKVEGLVPKFIPELRGYHYEGLHKWQRLVQRYSIGDRKTFWEYKDGQRLKGMKGFTGRHPIFVKEILERKWGL